LGKAFLNKTISLWSKVGGKKAAPYKNRNSLVKIRKLFSERDYIRYRYKETLLLLKKG